MASAMRVAGRAAVGIRVDLAGAAVEKVGEAGRNMLEALVAQRPDRRPFDPGRTIEQRRRRRHPRSCRRLLAQLRLAEQQNVVRRNGIAGREIREPPCHSDLVALKDSGIALDRLHERAGFALLGRAALAEAAGAAQSCPQLIDRPGGRRKIVRWRSSWCSAAGRLRSVRGARPRR